MVVTLCLPHIVVELDMGMVTKQMTYVRTMKITYDKSDNLGKHIREINTRLHEEGIATMDRYDDYDETNYGLFESVSKSRTYQLCINGELIHESPYLIMKKETQDVLNNVIGDLIHCSEITTERKETMHRRLNGNHLITVESTKNGTFQYGLEPSMCIIDENGINSNLMVTFDEGSSWSTRPTSITFTTTILSDGVLRKDDIERGVVDSTLETIGTVQAIFEKVLMSFDYDLSEPTIDCHFDAKSESRSECTPDIIERTRVEKERQLEIRRNEL